MGRCKFKIVRTCLCVTTITVVTWTQTQRRRKCVFFPQTFTPFDSNSDKVLAHRHTEWTRQFDYKHFTFELTSVFTGVTTDEDDYRPTVLHQVVMSSPSRMMRIPNDWFKESLRIINHLDGGGMDGWEHHPSTFMEILNVPVPFWVIFFILLFCFSYLFINVLARV